MNTQRRPSVHSGLLPKPYMDDDDWTHSEPPLITIVFPKYRGRSYPQALLTGQQAELYKEYLVLEALYHVASFAQSRHQATTALALMMLTANIKGTLVFGSDGVLVANKYRVESVLECYQKACLVNDYRAYCHSVINDPFIVRGTFEMMYSRQGTVDRYMLPCRLINKAYLEFDAQHPARAEDLIQAAAVNQGSHWCPNFNAKAFRKVEPYYPDAPAQQEILDL